MLLRLSTPGKERLFQSQNLMTNFVGAEANVGVTLSRFDNEVDMVTVVPDNPIGKACEDALHAQGINTRHIIKDGPRLAVYYLETGALIRPSRITYDRDNSSFAKFPAANYDWPTILKGADFLHVCGISLAVSESSYEASLAAVEAAARQNVKVSFDCNYRAALWNGREQHAIKQIRSILSRSTVLFAGPRDCNLLMGTSIDTSDAENAFAHSAKIFLEAFPSIQTVASTSRVVRSSDSNDLCGMIATRDSLAQSQTFQLNGIVDRIGGGDAFAGGVLHKIAEHAPLDEVISFGTASSAIKHSIPGDFNRTSVQEVETIAQGSGLDVQR